MLKTFHKGRTLLLSSRAAALLNVAAIAAGLVVGGPTLAIGLMVYSALGWLLYLVRPSSHLHLVSAGSDGRTAKLLSAAVCFATVVTCTLPMGLSQNWNGSEESEPHLRGYEALADALIHGHLDLYWNEDTSALQSLDNPYDMAQREGLQENVDYHWDHAFYKGKYYLYFGIVPALVVFVPWQLLCGHPLVSYHATQLFAALFIVGLFLLFRRLLKAFKLRMPLSVYLLASVASSLICMLCSIETPALYCVAVVSALCFEVWSLNFFIEAVYLREGNALQIPYAVLGGLCGALVFGCRPPIGIMNVLAFPMLFRYLSVRRVDVRTVGRVLLVLIPYVVVMGGLMAYNYARFENPFEFGAAYQLTIIDVASYVREFRQHGYVMGLLAGLATVFFSMGRAPLAAWIPAGTFPFVNLGGIFINYPMLLLIFYLLRRSSLGALRQRGLLGMVICLFVLAVVMAVLIVSWSPVVYERYHMDVYPSLVLLWFIAMALICTRQGTTQGVIAWALSCLCITTVITSCLLFWVPYNRNWSGLNPHQLDLAARALTLSGLLRRA